MSRFNSSLRLPNQRRRIGLIGLGLMGSALARRLCEHWHILGWDISAKARRRARLRVALAADATEVFSSCNQVFLSLPDSRAVEVVLRQAARGLRRGQTIIDTSTGDPQAAVDIATRLARRGITYLDATISGNSEQLGRGEVFLMVGGPKRAFDGCRELFKMFAAHSVHTGNSGTGAKMKLVTNLVLGLNRAALAEGLVFSRRLGLDGDQALMILRQSMAYSRIMDAKGEKMLRGDFRPHARLAQHLKDVQLMFAAARRTGARLPLTSAHRTLLKRSVALGLGPLDNCAIIRALESPRLPKISRNHSGPMLAQ